MKKERLFRVIGMIEDDLIKEAEDKQIIQKKSFSITAVWKWTAVAAGMLLIIGVKVFQDNLNKDVHSTTSLNGSSYMEITAASDKVEEEDIYEKSETAAGQSIAAPASSGELDGSQTDDRKENSEEGYFERNEKVALYIEVIEEIYQPYQGKVLYLNLENAVNLEKEQKESLSEVLATEYQISVVLGSFEELCKQGTIDAKAEEIEGIYITFEVISEAEDSFSFRIDCWGGENVVFGWQDCYAWYQENKWNYRLGEIR